MYLLWLVQCSQPQILLPVAADPEPATASGTRAFAFFFFFVTFHPEPFFVKQLVIFARFVSASYVHSNFSFSNPADHFNFSCLACDTNSSWLELCRGFEAFLFTLKE
jgi:hypothetical protein